MTNTICGLDRAALQWALSDPDPLTNAELDRKVIFAIGGVPDFASCVATHKQRAAACVTDPARLAEIMAELLRQFWPPPVYAVSVSWSDSLNMRIVITVDYNGRFGTVDGSHGWTMASARAIAHKLLCCQTPDDTLAALGATRP